MLYQVIKYYNLLKQGSIYIITTKKKIFNQKKNKGVSKQDIVTQTDETINLALYEEGSVCSCDDISKCYRISKNQINKKCKSWQNLIKQTRKQILFKHSHEYKSTLKFSVLRKPYYNVNHLSNHLSNKNDDNSSDFILKKVNIKINSDIKRLAIESDFITNKIARRVSI